jgi:post-segregation antitoxin (ccd killing protein)
MNDSPQSVGIFVHRDPYTVTTDAYARAKRYSVDHVSRLCKEGRIRAVRAYPRANWRIHEDELTVSK